MSGISGAIGVDQPGAIGVDHVDIVIKACPFCEKTNSLVMDFVWALQVSGQTCLFYAYFVQPHAVT